ncbi:hypothetical protein [Cohnella panacarvi]|uniref:hypothetical protein n=1 Tax=Cohnella panacarvi TaxID=400776 RepID=UPI00047D0E0D|nr:hypothetical protein [Cohnella panacarvi]
MNIGMFAVTTVAAAVIVRLEWNNVKQMSAKDKTVFFAVIVSGWVMTGLNLPQLPGLHTIFGIMFKPFRPLLEQ